MRCAGGEVAKRTGVGATPLFALMNHEAEQFSLHSLVKWSLF